MEGNSPHSCHPTFHVLPTHLQVYLEAASVPAAEPEAFALVSVAGDLSPEGEVLPAEPARGPVAAGLSPEVVFAAVVPVADVAGPPVSVDIAVAVVVLVPVSGLGVEGDSSGRPTCLAVPNAGHSASSASSVGVVGEESVDSPTGARSTHALGSILSTRDRHQNKILGRGHNMPNPGHNTGSDTTVLPRGATTNHSRRTSLRRYRGRRIPRSYQASRSPLEVPERRWVGAEQCQYLYRPLPSLA